mgnify:CR=1 FL=1
MMATNQTNRVAILRASTCEPQAPVELVLADVPLYEPPFISMNISVRDGLHSESKYSDEVSLLPSWMSSLTAQRVR